MEIFTKMMYVLPPWVGANKGMCGLCKGEREVGGKAGIYLS